MDPFSHDPFPPANDDGVQDRIQSRDSLFLMAEFRTAGDDATRQVRVRNLSAGGLMAEVPEGMDMGVLVELNVRGIGWLPGKVAWSTAGRIGVAFDQAIDPMLARKPVGLGRNAPVYGKPITPAR